MPTDLERLLESIDPERTIDMVERRIDEALNSFRVTKAVIDNWDEFVAFMVSFYRYFETRVNRLNPSRTSYVAFDWSRCCRMLKKEYGPRGDTIAFEMVRTGLEGGLYAVLRTIARRQAEEWISNEISARITHYWNRLSTDQMLASISEYVERYGYLLPSDLTEKGAIRIRANPIKVLMEHPYLIQRLHRLGR